MRTRAVVFAVSLSILFLSMASIVHAQQPEPTAAISISSPTHFGIYGAIAINNVDERLPIMWNWVLYEDGIIVNGGISGILGYGAGNYPFQCTTSVFVQAGYYQCIFGLSLEQGTSGSNANPITLYSATYYIV